MPIDYEALRNEIETDPLGLGYAGKSDIEIAALLNEVRDTIEIEVTIPYSADEIVEAIDPDELAALSVDDKETLQTLLVTGQINLSKPNIRAILESIFPAGTVTYDNLQKLYKRKGSRAEQLFGCGVRVHHLDVARALRGGV